VRERRYFICPRLDKREADKREPNSMVD
jgi:hypothetical protein